MTNPGAGNKITGTVADIKGTCNAGHKVGDTFDLSCHYADGLCGFFYHAIFHTIAVLQFGGAFPWWAEGQATFELECPDRKNAVTLKLECIQR